MWGIISKSAAENRPLWPNTVPLRLRDYYYPQSSVLGALLFIIYINDLHLKCPGAKTITFADDASPLFEGKDLSISTIESSHTIRKLAVG